jgi:S1-C subfamily serine protease
MYKLVNGYGYRLSFSNTTVTAGIISAKARSIGIIKPRSTNQANSGTTAIQQLNLLFKLMLQLIPEIVAVHL